MIYLKRNYQLPPPHVVDEVFPQAVKTKPRMKGVIIGFSDGKSDDDEQSTDEEMEGENEEDYSDSIDDIKPKGEDMEIEIEEFTLPDTIEGVRDHRYLIIPRWLTSNHRPIYKVKPRYLLQM